MTKMWNEVFQQHKMQSPTCDGELAWDLDVEQKWGLGWR